MHMPFIDISETIKSLESCIEEGWLKGLYKLLFTCARRQCSSETIRFISINSKDSRETARIHMRQQGFT